MDRANPLTVHHFFENGFVVVNENYLFLFGFVTSIPRGDSVGASWWRFVLLLVHSVYLDIFCDKKNNIFSLMTISVLDALTVHLKLETKILHIAQCCPFRNMPRNVARERKIRFCKNTLNQV